MDDSVKEEQAKSQRLASLVCIVCGVIGGWLQWLAMCGVVKGFGDSIPSEFGPLPVPVNVLVRVGIYSFQFTLPAIAGTVMLTALLFLRNRVAMKCAICCVYLLLWSTVSALVSWALAHSPVATGWRPL